MKCQGLQCPICISLPFGLSGRSILAFLLPERGGGGAARRLALRTTAASSWLIKADHGCFVGGAPFGKAMLPHATLRLCKAQSSRIHHSFSLWFSTDSAARSSPGSGAICHPPRRPWGGLVRHEIVHVVDGPKVLIASPPTTARHPSMC